MLPPRQPPSASSDSGDTSKGTSPATSLSDDQQQQDESDDSMSRPNRRRREGTKEKILSEVRGLVGLKEVKEQFDNIESCIRICHLQQTNPRAERWHAVFQGNPGTGKTTVARLYAKFLRCMHIVKSRTYKETSGAQLVCMGPKEVKELFESPGANPLQSLLGGRAPQRPAPRGNHSDDDDDDEDDDPASFKRTSSSLEPGCLSDGGVLFVDEAYQLTAPHAPSSGRQVLDIILTEIENNIGNLVVIFAGYKEELESFFGHNPGLQSRIPHTFHFKDFTDQELLHILANRIQKKYNSKMNAEDGIYGKFMRIAIRRLASSRGKKGFGNARAVENVLLKIWERQAKRLSKYKNLAQGHVFTFTKEDILGPDPEDVRRTSLAWAKLNQLTGLKEVKESINNMFEALVVNYRREMAELAPLIFSLNRIFVGSPGTGKTSVAKLYGQILVDLGLLSNGEVVTKNPADFIGEAVGKSEANTKSILAATVGKVLIIDEAYMLDPGESSNRSDSYRASVLDTLVAEVQSVPGEDRCVILLGYEDRLKEMFRNANPGLSGRFAADKPFRFEDFTPEQLWDILNKKLAARNLQATKEGLVTAMDVLNRARMRQGFSNGREVDNILSSAMENHLQRQSKTNGSNYGHDMILSPEDFDPDYGRAKYAATNCRATLQNQVSNSIINQLEEYQRLLNINKLRGAGAASLVPTSFVFKGPAGTGKTTVARYMGTLLYDLGLIATKTFVECSASDFIGEHVGHTAPKTRAQFEKGLGGVLFIDHAHQLNQGGYGTEAINEFVRLLQKHSGKIVIILAGPSEEIESLMAKAQGLDSSFFKEIFFQKLTAQECMAFLRRILSENGINDCFSSNQAVHHIFTNQFEILSNLTHWKNASDVKSLSQWMVMDALTNWIPQGQGSIGPSLSITQANVHIQKMFEKKAAMQMSDPNNIVDIFHQTDSAHMTNSFHMSENKSEAKCEAKCEATFNTQAVHAATDMRVSVDMEKTAHVAYDEQWDKVKSVQEALKHIGQCEAGFDWVREGSGYRCKGGSHYVTDAQIQSYSS
ncbi:ATPase family associated with various cellular activities (AAA) domain-containing protein [Trichoderma breve]|uniref:ATPase family associated with various cellular activities (AAA) domain-containing protein n=1 Tax=Trichoderma breve TaxID=2034170 RepID=A0A9W9BHX9_9HYPO|nr:ATPase family associated with various cellular activities (AAA) domain-containing protein [Trichoderma breve]KAJ4862574.1 ATPase family associated with various cellular activities (AAA) domain-containing protein [Trichoderma breve]